MSQEFKRKLAAYEKGELTGKVLEDFEKELEKLESYHELLEDDTDKQPTTILSNKKQKKIMKRGKWKARIQTAFTAIGIFIIFTIVSSILTAIYYSWGNPDRVDVFRGIIDHTLTVTDPYGYLGGTSMNSKAYYGLEATRDINKKVGNESIKVGELEINFILSLMGMPEEDYLGKITQNQPSFFYPGDANGNMSDWNKLDKLPEGTVVSAYISFDELMETKEVEQLFANKEMNLLWLVVDTGLEGTDDWYVFEPIGFPSSPIWHDDDMILQSSEEEKGLFGSGTKSESYSSPGYHEGDQSVLHEQFLKTLNFLKEHERKANNLVFGKLRLSERIDYLEKNGIQHYGVVITGPTKEILKLQDEPRVSALEVDEVEFWNWD
ncbi:anti-sigma factor [Ornithinibacillus salinisoli]|uniref:Anti-sigma factor n=1 Tax=Ornithinibacillus salinisoli TaxID=1848459 RepID=A0ABW4VZQ2_9BACI